MVEGSVLGSSKFDSAFYVFEVDETITRNSSNFGRKTNFSPLSVSFLSFETTEHYPSNRVKILSFVDLGL